MIIRWRIDDELRFDSRVANYILKSLAYLRPELFTIAKLAKTKLNKFTRRTRSACTRMRASESISRARGPFSGKPAAGLHVPHKEKRLHPTKAFARMRQERELRKLEKQRGRKVREKEAWKRRADFTAKTRQSPSLAHLPILHGGSFLCSHPLRA